jgi:hypothetical protein
MAKQLKKTSETFGIAEWYGFPFGLLSEEQRRHFAEIQVATKADRPFVPCPFLSRPEQLIACWKKGGVCSLRKYGLVIDQDGRRTAEFRDHQIRTTCPSRFDEIGEIYRWIGREILGTEEAVPIGQVPFLKPVPQMGTTTGDAGIATGKEVGRIDNILVVPGTKPLDWCAVEVQAVYFSGATMNGDFEYIRDYVGPGIPYPVGRRHPDYRSSGPKRLLPQLQIKVPTLRTWGKKMAVVVDESFFAALGKMNPADDISNAEVVWFVVRYENADAEPRLVRGQVFLSRLEEAQAGLVAAKPATLAQFEKQILSKLPRA